MGTRLTASRFLLVIYLVLLAVSHGIRAFSDDAVDRPSGARFAALSAVDGDDLTDRGAAMIWRDLGPPEPEATILLIHGSPGEGANFALVSADLADRFRLIVPDLPGFGASSRKVPDLSARAHARYLLQLLDAEGIDRVHVVGFSLGGPVGLYLEDIAPERVASITLLAATGVQELELLGDYHVNRLVHGLQLAAIWMATEALPHMGLLDGGFLDVAYARNFFETDQRPARGVLERYAGPMLILHGRRDVLVPVAAAREHHRLVPQSDLRLYDSDHFMVFRPDEAREIASRIAGFVAEAEAGRAPRRADADPARRALAAEPFDPRSIPEATGLTLVVFMALIALATLASEDLTCITVGWMVAAGRLGFVAGTAACLVGIFLGDLALFLAGRWVGRPALRRPPLRWLVRPERVEAGRAWLRRRGPLVILLSRFMPGTRLPTYVAAGAAGIPVRTFAGWFLLAAVLWTPLLVGVAVLLGRPVRRWVEGAAHWTLVGLAVVAVVAFVLVRVAVPLATHRGRRRLLGTWRRWTRWEFWPLWLFYPPVTVYLLWLGLRYRHPTLFTAANPAIPHGGVVGESKSAILDRLAGPAAGRIARYRLLPAGSDVAERLRRVRVFRDELGVGYPLVLKPDAGQRGLDVRIVRDADEALRYLEAHRGPTLVQEYVTGREYGVFYVRLPDEPRGRIFSVTDKRLPEVIGDGRRSLEQLIRDDDRAVAIASVYLTANAARLSAIPDAGETVPLVELGTHCRGAVFLDGGRLVTPALEQAIEELSRTADGFHFGRYDIKVPSEEDFRAGRNLTVIELNGVTSEATHIYDPALGLRNAYRTLFAQWRLAFEAGRQNRARGHRPTGPVTLLREALRFARARRAPASS